MLNGFIKELPGDRLFVPIEEYDLRWGYSHDMAEDLQLYVETNNRAPSELSLLDYPEAVITFGHGSTLYKGRRTVNGLAIEEWVVKGGLFEDNREGYQFILTVNEKGSAIYKPMVKISMDYEIPRKRSQQPILTEAELMTIWQQVTSSLRLRPGAISPMTHG